MVKIKEYKIQKHGAGVMLSLPKVWLDDLGLSFGDKIEMYRDIDDRLLIVPKVKKDAPDDQASSLRELMGGEA